MMIVPAQARTFSCVRHACPIAAHAMAQMPSLRVDFAQHRLAYARQDAALGAVLRREVKQLIQALIPASVRANPKAIREVAVPAAWKERVRGEVRTVLRSTWAAGQASARAELRRAAPGKFTYDPGEARDEQGKWTGEGDQRAATLSEIADVMLSGSHLFVFTGEELQVHEGLGSHAGVFGRQAVHDYWQGRYSKQINLAYIEPPGATTLPDSKLRVPGGLVGSLRDKFPGVRIVNLGPGGKLTRFDLSPSTLPEYIDTLAYNLTESLGSDVVEKLRPIWAQALAQDWSSSMLSDKLLGALGGYVDASGSDLTPARIATIVRTTDTNAYNLARKEVFEDPALNGFVEAYEYSAILDDRTTALCEELDGKVYPVDYPFWDEFTPPNHFNCRSLLIPVVQGDEWTASKPVSKDVQPQEGFHIGPDAA